LAGVYFALAGAAVGGALVGGEAFYMREGGAWGKAQKLRQAQIARKKQDESNAKAQKERSSEWYC